MKYTVADPILDRWGRENSVPWVHTHRDEETRSADIYLSPGRSAQLWLEAQASPDHFAVCVWDRNLRKNREIVSLDELDSALTRGLQIIRSWIAASHAV